MTNITIEVMGVIATTNGVDWKCEKLTVQNYLNTISNRNLITTYCPDYATALLELVEKSIRNVKVLSVTNQFAPKPGVVY